MGFLDVLSTIDALVWIGPASVTEKIRESRYSAKSELGKYAYGLAAGVIEGVMDLHHLFTNDTDRALREEGTIEYDEGGSGVAYPTSLGELDKRAIVVERYARKATMATALVVYSCAIALDAGAIYPFIIFNSIDLADDWKMEEEANNSYQF